MLKCKMFSILVLMVMVSLTAQADTGIIVKVVDGDTLKIGTAEGIRNYRLALVDTPETYNNSKAKKDIKLCKISKKRMFALGDSAKAYVVRKYPVGSNITYTVLGVGRYKRPIIWVDGLIYNLILQGYGRVVDYHNVPRANVTRGRVLETISRDAKFGLWKTLTCWEPKKK